MRLILLALFIVAGLTGRPAAASGSQITSADAKRVLDATLTLQSADGRETFLGSGFVYERGDRAITNAHVVGKSRVVIAVTHHGQRVRATVVALDEVRDLAVLELETSLEHVLLPATGFLEVGQTVFAAGAPLEATFTLTIGIVSAYDRQIDPTQPVDYLQHSAPLNPGSSGGPLVNSKGMVIGVNARIADGSRFFVGIAYAVPLSDVIDLVSYGPLPVYPAPGLLLRPITEQIANALGHSGPGVLIDEVRTDTPGARAGLNPGDILIAADRHEIRNPGDFAFALADLGAVLDVTIIRGGQTLVLELRREEPPKLVLTVDSSSAPKAHETYTLTEMGLRLDADGTIRDVYGDGAGYIAGLTKEDVIEAINGISVADMADSWLTDFTFDAPIVLRIRLAAGGTRHYVLDPWEPGNGLRLSSGANMLAREVVNFD